MDLGPTKKTWKSVTTVRSSAPSHFLRTPLSGIPSFTNVNIRVGPRPSAKARVGHDKIVGSRYRHPEWTNPPSICSFAFWTHSSFFGSAGESVDRTAGGNGSLLPPVFLGEADAFRRRYRANICTDRKKSLSLHVLLTSSFVSLTKHFLKSVAFSQFSFFLASSKQTLRSFSHCAQTSLSISFDFSSKQFTRLVPALHSFAKSSLQAAAKERIRGAATYA